MSRRRSFDPRIAMSPREARSWLDACLAAAPDRRRWIAEAADAIPNHRVMNELIRENEEAADENRRFGILESVRDARIQCVLAKIMRCVGVWLDMLPPLHGAYNLVRRAEPIRASIVDGALAAGVDSNELHELLTKSLFHAGPWLDGTARVVIDKRIAGARGGAS